MKKTKKKMEMTNDDGSGHSAFPLVFLPIEMRKTISFFDLLHFFQQLRLHSISGLLLLLLTKFAACASNRKADFSVQTTTMPATRLRGQIGCYSCFSWTEWSASGYRQHNNDSRMDAGQKKQFDNRTELAQMFRDAGMRVPVWANRCTETSPTGRPNFAGADLRVCGNSVEKPGACVKLKGMYKGRWYVYRECWDRMWAETRAYHHEYTGKCYADKPVQQFVASERNILCFCEEDLCNGGQRRQPQHQFWHIFMKTATTTLIISFLLSMFFYAN